MIWDFAFPTQNLSSHFEFGSYASDALVTSVVDYVLAVRTPPINNNKSKKRVGAKETKKDGET